jgi:glycine cleavage system H protein
VTVPEDRRYTDQHEWALMEDSGVRLGITDYAQEALGDVVFVGLPEIGRHFRAGETVAEIDSTKSVAEVFAPLDGTVLEVNETLADHPELVNTDPYGEGWIVLLEADDSTALDALLDAAAYRSLTG